LLGKAVLALVNAASLEMDQAAAERKKGIPKRPSRRICIANIRRLCAQQPD